MDCLIDSNKMNFAYILMKNVGLCCRINGYLWFPYLR